jgi:hypothetical protein
LQQCCAQRFAERSCLLASFTTTHPLERSARFTGASLARNADGRGRTLSCQFRRLGGSMHQRRCGPSFHACARLPPLGPQPRFMRYVRRSPFPPPVSVRRSASIFMQETRPYISPRSMATVTSYAIPKRARPGSSCQPVLPETGQVSNERACGSEREAIL